MPMVCMPKAFPVSLRALISPSMIALSRLAGLALAFLVAGAAMAQADPTGEWVVADGFARIRVVGCGDRMWGVVSWEEKPETDKNNPDPSKRSRPTLGMPVLLGMKATQRNRWEGEIYNSQDGRTYSASISLSNPDTLRVQGCVLGFLCGGENWPRAKLASPPASPPRGTDTRRTRAQDNWIPGGATKISSASAEQLCSGLAGLSRLSH